MKISIITVCFNDLNGLVKTISSVEQLNYSDRELIVVDGLSSDGSQKFILSNPSIDKKIIEKDSGIYNAMNKGVLAAEGAYVIFMNAGDVFSDSASLDFFEKNDVMLDYGLIYGDVYQDGSGKSSLVKSRSLIHLWKGMVFSHQSLFSKRELLLSEPFDEAKRISADYDFILRCHQKGEKFKYIDKVIACVENGGVSQQFQIESTKERYNSIVDANMSGFLVFVYYQYLLLKITSKRLLKWLLKNKI